VDRYLGRSLTTGNIDGRPKEGHGLMEVALGSWECDDDAIATLTPPSAFTYGQEPVLRRAGSSTNNTPRMDMIIHMFQIRPANDPVRTPEDLVLQ